MYVARRSQICKRKSRRWVNANVAITGNQPFGSVRKAREALKERAHELLELYISGMKRALDAGDYETFQKGMANIVSHIPQEDGASVFDTDVDKKQIDVAGHTGPAIQIGVSIGGVPRPELPPVQVIEIKSDDPTD
jgi:hypothetical protein